MGGEWKLQAAKHCRMQRAKTEDRHRLYLYLCCRRRPRWPSSIWRSAPGPGWLCSGRRSPGTGWRSRSPCCLTPGASTWSGCGAPPTRCRWTGPRWPTSCETGQKWPPPRGKADRMLLKEATLISPVSPLVLAVTNKEQVLNPRSDNSKLKLISPDCYRLPGFCSHTAYQHKTIF